MNDRNKRVISILTIFTIIFTVMGGSLAYWNWSSSEASRTGVAFTIDKDFSCSADGGGHITPANISLEPSSCTNPNTSIKRKIVVTPDINKNGLEISLDMWLNVNSLGTGLSNSVNLKYVLTTSDTSCEEGTIISKGNFSSKTSGDRVMLLEKNYTADASEPYYLYIWLDKEESSPDTMDQSFDFSLGGNCSNYVGEPESPVLDPAMIPVTIANDGKVTTVSKDDPNWYSYENKQWANIVLVNENATEGVTDSHSRSYYQNNIGEEVTEEDIVAYYVWIPRYKYKIPTNKYCYDIENPTIEANPECYGAPYTLTISEEEAKVKIVNGVIGKASDLIGCYDYETSEELPCDVSNVEDHYFNASMDEVLEEMLNKDKFDTLYGSESISDFLSDSDYIESFVSNRYLTGNPTSIDIIFESKDEDLILGNAMTEYRSHPAFWNDEDNDNILDNDETISGFWVPKFEPSLYDNIEQCAHGSDYDGDGLLDGDDLVGEGNPEDIDCYETINTPITNYLPLKNSLSDVEIGPASASLLIVNKNNFAFDNSSIKMDLINNKEWGAIAYLSHSNYGINEEIRINNTIITGCGASSSNASAAADYDNLTSCEIKYGSGVSSYPQSTTGNITGVFDMSGSKYEFVIDNDDDFYDRPPDGGFLVLRDNVCMDGRCKGQAIEEVKNWYNDNYNFYDGVELDSDCYRGGSYADKQTAGAFAFYTASGTTWGQNKIIISRHTIIVK